MAKNTKTLNKFLTGSVTAAMVATAIVPVVSADTATEFSYSDVSATNTHYSNIMKARELGLFSGYTDGTFQPNAGLTRANVVKVLGKYVVAKSGKALSEFDLSGVTPFNDVTASHADKELYTYSLIVKQAGVFSGSNNNLMPTTLISRQQMAKVVVNAFGLKDLPGDLSKVTDNSKAQAEFRPLIDILSENAVTSETSFRPTETTTRAQFASFAVRAYEVANPATPEVVSVSAINGKQLVVTFGTAIDKATVIEANSTLKDGIISISGLNKADGTASAAVTANAASASLSADGKTLTIEAAGNEVFDGRYTVQVNKGVKTTTGVAVPVFSTFVNVSDTAAPVLVSTSAIARTTTNSVTLSFNEPVQASGVIVYVNGAAVNVQAGAKSNELLVTTGTALAAGSTNQLSVLNVKDFSGNFISPNPLTSSFTVLADTVAPSVTGVKVVGENQVEVTYSKNMNEASFANNARILDANGVSVTLLNADVDGKVVTLTTASALNFGPNGTFTGNLLLGTDIADTLGNKAGSTFSQAVTFTKDTVAPSVASVSFASGKLNVTFTEDVAPQATTLAGTTVINNNTGVVTDLGAIAFGANPATEASIVDNKLVIPTTLAAGDYTLRLPANLVKDGAVSANKNVAAVTTFIISATAPGSDVTKPVFTNDATFTNNLNITTSGTNLTPEQTISYIVQDASGLDLTTVRNVNNYTLDGKALPAGSYVTTNFTGTEATALTVTIHLDSTKVTESKDTYKLVASNIKDKAGNFANPQVSEDFSLIEGVKPLLTTATVSAGDSTTLVLGFSEDVLAVDETDFDFTINTVNVNDAASLTAITAGTDKGKYYVTFDTVTNAGKLYVDLGTAGYDAGDLELATTTDAAGFLNLNASYVNSVKVAVDAESDITDGDDNVIVLGTEKVAK